MSVQDKSSAPSNLQIMRALLAKDWRFFRVPAIAVTVIGFGCYLLVMAATLHIRRNSNGVFAEVELPSNMAVFAAGLTSLLAAAFGGLAIAGERRDRTADFLALLPISRWQIILSKCLIAACILIVVGLGHGLAALATRSSNGLGMGSSDLAACAAMWIGCTTSFFGVAWLFGTFTRSPTISACASIAITVALFLLFSVGIHDSAVTSVSLALGLPVMGWGLLAMFTGTTYYLRRVSP